MTQSEEYTKAVNRTYSKTFSKNQFIPKIIPKYIIPSAKILDFGAGYDAFGTLALRDKGYNVTAYEIGKNFNPLVHDPKALHRKYDCVFTSNVLNVQPSKVMVNTVIRAVKKVMNPKGVYICNFPASPRKNDYNVKGLDEALNAHFFHVTRIAVDPPTWMCRSPV